MKALFVLIFFQKLDKQLNKDVTHHKVNYNLIEHSLKQWRENNSCHFPLRHSQGR